MGTTITLDMLVVAIQEEVGTILGGGSWGMNIFCFRGGGGGSLRLYSPPSNLDRKTKRPCGFFTILL